MLERDHQPDLLLVSLGELLEASRRIDVEALDQLGLVRLVDATAEVAEIGQRLAAGQSVIERELPGDVAEALVDRDRIAARLDSEDVGAAAGRADQIQDRADGGRLPRAIGAQEAEHLPGL